MAFLWASAAAAAVASQASTPATADAVLGHWEQVGIPDAWVAETERPANQTRSQSRHLSPCACCTRSQSAMSVYTVCGAGGGHTQRRAGASASAPLDLRHIRLAGGRQTAVTGSILANMVVVRLLRRAGRAGREMFGDHFWEAVAARRRCGRPKRVGAQNPPPALSASPDIIYLSLHDTVDGVRQVQGQLRPLFLPFIYLIYLHCLRNPNGLVLGRLLQQGRSGQEARS